MSTGSLSYYDGKHLSHHSKQVGTNPVWPAATMSDTTETEPDLSWREKARALYRVVQFQPIFSTGVILLAVVAALFEGIGLTFIEPIIKVSQSGPSVEEANGLLEVFISVYDVLGVPFRLGSLVGGVTLVMVIRYTTSFLVEWFRAAIETRYVRHLQEEGFMNALDARVKYFDEEGSDDILNAIVTQAEYAGKVIRYAINTVQYGLLVVVYFAIAFYIAPLLAIATAGFLGAMTFFFRHVLDTGYSLGDEVADAKEGIQSNAQAGTQGIRDVKLYGMVDELRTGFANAVEQFEEARIKLLRNEAAIRSFYELTVAVTVFGLIYVALTFSSLSMGELGVFLFAMFQLGPKVSAFNKYGYRLEGELPHLIRTQEFIDKLQRSQEPVEGTQPVPNSITQFAFDDVYFSYSSDDETALQGVSFTFNRGDFVAFVGPSGAGKSTIASLFARMYEPDTGEITVDRKPIADFDIREWRSRVSVIRQDPHMFNETLRRNITIGNRGATQREVEEVAELAQVTEFLDELPDGYDTILGDQGMRLSGGQRQRVALARALLKDADLLILDEATSDLDTSLEKAVHEGIEMMDRDYAMLVIAHRLSTVTNADKIYTLEDGKIAETGTHNELVKNSGTYAQLYALQST